MYLVIIEVIFRSLDSSLDYSNIYSLRANVLSAKWCKFLFFIFVGVRQERVEIKNKKPFYLLTKLAHETLWRYIRLYS